MQIEIKILKSEINQGRHFNFLFVGAKMFAGHSYHYQATKKTSFFLDRMGSSGQVNITFYYNYFRFQCIHPFLAF